MRLIEDLFDGSVRVARQAHLRRSEHRLVRVIPARATSFHQLWLEGALLVRWLLLLPLKLQVAHKGLLVQLIGSLSRVNLSSARSVAHILCVEPLIAPLNELCRFLEDAWLEGGLLHLLPLQVRL